MSEHQHGDEKHNPGEPEFGEQHGTGEHNPGEPEFGQTETDEGEDVTSGDEAADRADVGHS